MINTTVRPTREYNIRFDNHCRIFVDGANPSFIRALKAEKVKIQSTTQIQRLKSELSPIFYNLTF